VQTTLKAARPSRVELTLRGLALGGLITLVFTAANVYLGLKVGLTFASSIPAAVISMAILRGFKTSTIWENNIVQTVASAAGTLSSIIFVLPGLVIVGWWTGFPFWESFGVCAVGGILGVMYSVPLRRALVTNSDLPYPEGVAAAEVLEVGAGAHAADAAAENALGLRALIVSSIASAAVQLGIALRLFQGSFAGYLRIGPAITGMGFNLSLALIGAGHLIGLTVGMAIFGGLFIAWGILIPVITAMHPMPGAIGDVANTVRSTDVRFIGAGLIGAAGIWTLFKLIAPIASGIQSSLRASAARNRGDTLDITEQDIPFNIVVLVSAACLIPIAILLYAFLAGGVLQPMIVPLILASIVYIVIAGLFVAAVTGYMAGLIGSSNSPVSGMAILTVVGVSLLLLLIAKADPATTPALIAYALFVTAIVLNVATISNDNLQDLKTGQIVGATPWKQQVALVVGVIFGAIIIPPVLVVLNAAYGFGGKALAAPQAVLISTLAKGVISSNAPWNLIAIGAGIGAIVIAIDEIGRITGRYRFPPLAVGLGVYLPPETTAPAVVGAVFGALYNRWVSFGPNPDAARRLGVLIACGLIVGESLWGVFYAGVIVAAQSGRLHVADPSNPFAIVGDNFGAIANVLAIVAFIAVPVALYRWVATRARAL
jgi:putative OPT family oligopeptide transporter